MERRGASSRATRVPPTGCEKAADTAQAKFGGERAGDVYLRRIDGMIYGDSP